MASGKPDTVLGPYRVVRQIGSGGMASIFEAIDGRLGRRVALKRLHPHVAERPGATERFLREGHAAARIRHPHVVQVFDLGTAGSTLFLAMELLEGSDLGAVLGREGRLGVDAALELLLPVLAAVAAAHDAGVVHRDLKPSNVFVSQGPGGRPWSTVLDFGVSKVLVDDDAGSLTATDGVIGTAAYMAPEQARAARAASTLSDQYSLAVILYQCLTGKLPFSGDGVYDLFQAIMTAPVLSPSQRVEGVPPELDAIVLRAMSRDPRERFRSVRAFGAALLPHARDRDRLAWSGELYEGPGPPVSPRPARSAGVDVAPATGLAPPLTSPPTVRDTRATTAWGHVPRRVLLGVLALAGLVGAGAWAGHRDVAIPPRVDPLGTTGTAIVVAPASPGPSAGASAVSIAPVEPVAAPTSSAPRSPPGPVPRAPAPPRVPRSPPVATASPSIAVVPSARTPTLTIGDNGAPILPP